MHRRPPTRGRGKAEHEMCCLHPLTRAELTLLTAESGPMPPSIEEEVASAACPGATAHPPSPDKAKQLPP
eukprot:3773757-Lingulodinium_polyedra.AAC.1